MKKLRFTFLMCLVVLVIALVIPGSPLLTFFSAGSQNHQVYDNQTRLVSQADSYTYANRKGTTGPVALDLTFNLDGIETLWELTCTKDTTLSYTSDLNLKSGRAKLILVGDDDTLHTLVEGNQAGDFSLPISKGHYRVRIVADQGIGQVLLNWSFDLSDVIMTVVD